MSDIRKWFMKQHNKDTGNGGALKSAKPEPEKLSFPTAKLEEQGSGGKESSGRKKTSKYFSSGKQNLDNEKDSNETSLKRKAQKDGEDVIDDFKSASKKKLQSVIDADEDDDVLVHPSSGKGSGQATSNKKLKTGLGRGLSKRTVSVDDSDEDNAKDNKSRPKIAGRGRGGKGVSPAPSGKRVVDANESDKDDEDDTDMTPFKSSTRGRGGRGASAAGGRGRGGGGRGGFMNFGARKDPPHKGQKEIPEGAPDCLAGLTFVISGTLDSLEREEAENLIKRYGGRITGSVSKKTNYLLCDEDIEGRKSQKAKELGTSFLTEDGLFDMIRSSKKSSSAKREESKEPIEKKEASTLPKKCLQKLEKEEHQVASSLARSGTTKTSTPDASRKKAPPTEHALLPWTEKYRPKVPNDIVGNQSLVKQLHDWLANWNDQFLNTSVKGKGKKQNDAGAKKVVLLSGTPGIGKTTSAKLVSQMLRLRIIEVNASDNRGKADSNINKGIGGSIANSIKELVNNETLEFNSTRSKHPKEVLIMDEVDGMSAGDRGGVADLIASIKISKIPIICICNDRYSQKLKSLVNYCLLLNFRKPTKQQMAKRLLQIANAEGLEVNEIAMEELAERVNGDMRMALNQLHYMSLSMPVIKYDDVRQRLLSSSKDEDISPFTAVDKLFSFNAGKLRMDERTDLSMSDPDLVPLIIQENYINYRPCSIGKDDNGIKRMSLLAHAADSIASGDLINVQIRRYRQWQLLPSSSLASSIIPAALLHGQRETLEQGERNFNRFGGWLGKNSTMGKNYRLLEDLHVHLLASRKSNLGRTTLRCDYLSVLLMRLTDPLRVLPKDESVEKVVEFMDSYSISMEDFDTIVEISKFQGHRSPLDGIQPAVKAALTKAYRKGGGSRSIRTADMITVPGKKRAPKKRIAAMLEPLGDDSMDGTGDALVENEENALDSEDSENIADDDKNVKLDLQSLNSKGIQVDVKETGKGSAKKTPASRGKQVSETITGKKSGGGHGSRVAATKRKR